MDNLVIALIRCCNKCYFRLCLFFRGSRVILCYKNTFSKTGGCDHAHLMDIQVVHKACGWVSDDNLCQSESVQSQPAPAAGIFVDRRAQELIEEATKRYCRRSTSGSSGTSRTVPVIDWAGARGDSARRSAKTHVPERDVIPRTRSRTSAPLYAGAESVCAISARAVRR